MQKTAKHYTPLERELLDVLVKVVAENGMQPTTAAEIVAPLFSRKPTAIEAQLVVRKTDWVKVLQYEMAIAHQRPFATLKHQVPEIDEVEPKPEPETPVESMTPPVMPDEPESKPVIKTPVPKIEVQEKPKTHTKTAIQSPGKTPFKDPIQPKPDESILDKVFGNKPLTVNNPTPSIIEKPKETKKEVTSGMDMEVVVEGIKPFGAFVKSIEHDVYGLLHIRNVADGFISNINDYLQVGQKVNARITVLPDGRYEFDGKNTKNPNITKRTLSTNK